MGKTYGYARVSTRTQRLDRQIDNITAYTKIDKMYAEKYTGTKSEGRVEFQKLYTKVQDGDTIVFDSVSRMSRNATEGVEQYMDFFARGVNLIFLKESYINTDIYRNAIEQSISATGNEIADIYIEATNKVIKLLAEKQIVKAFEQAAKEVEDLRIRVSEGMRTTQKNNLLLPEAERTQIGQKKGTKLITKKSIEMKSKIVKMAKSFEGNMSDKEVIETLKITRNTYYKYKKEIFDMAV